jgi:hypothetical protein
MLAYRHIISLRSEFPEIYEEIFSGQIENLWATMQLKLRAVQMLEGQPQVKPGDDQGNSDTNES